GENQPNSSSSAKAAFQPNNDERLLSYLEAAIKLSTTLGAIQSAVAPVLGWPKCRSACATLAVAHSEGGTLLHHTPGEGGNEAIKEDVVEQRDRQADDEACHHARAPEI